MREVEYSVRNTDIQDGPALSNVGGELKILSGEEPTRTFTNWRVHSDQVRVTLPQFSGANMLLSVMSGGEAMPQWVMLRLQYERYSPIDSGGLTPVFNPRVAIPCDGWSVEEGRTHFPIDPAHCGAPMSFGRTDGDSQVLRFRVPDAVAEFIVHSPEWQITWTLKQPDGAAYPQEAPLQLPPIAFHRTGSTRSLDLRSASSFAPARSRLDLGLRDIHQWVTDCSRTDLIG